MSTVWKAQLASVKFWGTKDVGAWKYRVNIDNQDTLRMGGAWKVDGKCTYLHFLHASALKFFVFFLKLKYVFEA